MAATSHPEFNEQTEGLEVSKAYAEGVRGKTVVITGVNRGGIGFSTAEAFVCTAYICFLHGFNECLGLSIPRPPHLRQP
jgi:hypothetical protein